MKHLTFGEKTLFVGDEAADALTAYAALLAEHDHADTVSLSAVGPDGHGVEATFVLDAGTVLMSESADDVFKEPDNSAAIQYIAERSEAILHPPQAQPATWDEQGEFRAFESDVESTF